MAEKKTTRRSPAASGPRPASRPFTLSTGWAAGILALLTVLFFHDVTLGGKTFVSPDALQPAGFVRMGEQSLYHDHVYPLWNPFVFLGMPSFGSGAYNPLIYPPDWPVALIQKALPLPDVSWLLLYYFLGGLFLYLLAREWGARPEGALLGGAAFVFGPNLVAVGTNGHGSQLVNSAYIPLILWLATRWMKRGGLHHLALLALAGGFQLLRGHVQICFYTWIGVAIYTAVELMAALRRPAEMPGLIARAAAVGGAMALAFGIAGFFNLPLRDYARYSIRGGGTGGGVGMDYATQWSLAPYELPSVLVSWWAGFGDQTYWGGMPFTNYPNAYLGMVAVVLALPAFLGKGAPRLFALALALVALLISFGKNFPVYGLLYDHLPLFNKFRVPVMVIVLFQLAGALALAWGWSATLEPVESSNAKGTRRSPLDRLLLATALTLVLALVIGVMGQGAWRDGYIRLALAKHQPYGADAAAFAYEKFVSDLGLACVLGLLALGSAWLVRRGRLPVSIATLAALTLLLADLWPVSARVMQPVIGDKTQQNLELGRDDVVSFLEKAGPRGSFRVVPSPSDPEFWEDFRSNRYAGFGIATLGGYHAAKPQLMQDLIERSFQVTPAFWRLLNVRFVIARHPLGNPPAFLKPVYQGSETIYENLAALPRATVVGAYRVAKADTSVLDSIAAMRHDPATFTYLDKAPLPAPGNVVGAGAEITSYRLNDVTVDVNTPCPGILRLADQWYPDWTATVDGRTAAVLRADYLLRAVAVPAGHHRVVFRFESRSVKQGLTLSLVSLALVLLLLTFGLARARRPAGAEA